MIFRQHPFLRPEGREDLRRSLITGAQLRGFKVRNRWRRLIETARVCVRIAADERRASSPRDVQAKLSTTRAMMR